MIKPTVSPRVCTALCGHEYVSDSRAGRRRKYCDACKPIPAKPQGKVTCGHCGETFTFPKRNGPAPTYCSDLCKGRANLHRRKISGGYEADLARRRAEYSPLGVRNFECKHCGGIFQNAHAKKYCSDRCSQLRRDARSELVCQEDGCDRGVRAKGLCNMHWRRKARAEGRESAPAWDERRKANYHKRRAQKRTTQVEDLEPLDIYERDIWLCGLCMTPVDSDLSWPDPRSASLDHILPLSKGGTHTYENVQLAHLNCNVSKGNRTAA